MSPWYFGSSQPLYFDTLCQDSKHHRFQIMMKPDLSTASLHVINASELTPHNFNFVTFQDYTICEDTIVSCWCNASYIGRRNNQNQCGVYTARLANISCGGPASAAMMSLPDMGTKYVLCWCSAPGRFVRLDSTNSVVVLDLF